jgi:tetratricopeptide (TPR) repeat protein
VPHLEVKSVIATLAVLIGTEFGPGCEAAQAAAQRRPRAATEARTGSFTDILTPAWRAFYAGNLDRASELAGAALRVNAADTGARLVMVRVAMERGDMEEAYNQLLRARRHAPDSPDVLYYLGIVSADLARSAFDALYKVAPDSARVHQLMAESLEAQDKGAEAIAEYEAALRVDPHLLDALLGLGKLKRIRLACDEAIPLYERAEAIRATFDGAFGLGACFAVQQDQEQAIARYRQALAHDQHAAVAWEGLGTALTRAGRPTEGIAALQRAIALEPGLGEAYYSLGLAYRKAGDEERANGAFEKARELQVGQRR